MRRHGPEEAFDDGPLFSKPPTNGTATSAAAAASIESSANRLRQKVYEFIRSRGELGATRQDCELALELSGNTVRPRVLELIRAGKVYVVEGVWTYTESGRKAEVLRAALG